MMELTSQKLLVLCGTQRAIISFLFNPTDTKILTKRSILSAIARLYDPLGLIGPVITITKIFMQQLWKLDLQWDESLPQHFLTSWLSYTANFNSISHFTFPRYVLIPVGKIEIHAFCDAILSAYGDCFYQCSELDGVTKVALLCSKYRVSPLKCLTTL